MADLEEILKVLIAGKSSLGYTFWISAVIYIITKLPDILSKFIDVRLKHLEMLEKEDEYKNKKEDRNEDIEG